MRIITNADDFGFSPETVAATIECLERGALTSATIMATMPASAEAVAYARAHPEKSFGAHLTYVGDGVERALSPAPEIPDLALASGLFRPSNDVRKAAMLGRVRVAQVERETVAQLENLRGRGVPIAHVDSHGHLHKFGPFRAALRNVLPRFGIARVRSAQDLYLSRPLKSPTYWLGPWWRARLRALFPATTDHFFMPTSSWETDWTGALLDRLALIERARGAQGRTLTVEVGVHPGYATEPWRNDEREAIQRFAQEARRRGHDLIGWKDLAARVAVQGTDGS